jgi:hypothetical protein
MSETLTQKQVRLVLEKQCRQLAELLKSQVPAGVGFMLWLTDYGESGNMAYVSTCDRESAHKLAQEWLDLDDANHPAEGWETAAMFVMELAKAINFKGEPEPGALLEECRRLAAKE